MTNKDYDKALYQVTMAIALGIKAGIQNDTIAKGVISLDCIGVIASEQPGRFSVVVKGESIEGKQDGWRKLANKEA